MKIEVSQGRPVEIHLEGLEGVIEIEWFSKSAVVSVHTHDLDSGERFAFESREVLESRPIPVLVEMEA